MIDVVYEVFEDDYGDRHIEYKPTSRSWVRRKLNGDPEDALQHACAELAPAVPVAMSRVQEDNACTFLEMTKALVAGTGGTEYQKAKRSRAVAFGCLLKAQQNIREGKRRGNDGYRTFEGRG